MAATQAEATIMLVPKPLLDYGQSSRLGQRSRAARLPHPTTRHEPDLPLRRRHHYPVPPHRLGQVRDGEERSGGQGWPKPVVDVMGEAGFQTIFRAAEIDDRDVSMNASIGAQK
jgi:hypothetical protein